MEMQTSQSLKENWTLIDLFINDCLYTISGGNSYNRNITGNNHWHDVVYL